MAYRWLMLTIPAISLASVLTACERNQDQLTPAAKTEAGKEKAEDHPSTKNSEQPDHSIGGNNSATSRQDGQPPTSASGNNPTGTGGSGDPAGR